MNMEFLKKYAFLRGLNLGQAEKDYYQNLVLFSLYSKISRELVFKGGTALAKCYGLPRFSEDLDFTATKQGKYIPIIEEGLTAFNIPFKTTAIYRADACEKYRIKIEGPLHQNVEKTLCSITIDLSFREKIALEPNIITIANHMDVIPAFDVFVMQEEEILAEKMRAVMTRESARDLYDIHFLAKKGIKVDKKLINSKLELVNLSFEREQFMAKCKSLKPLWGSELKSLVKNIPDFDSCIAFVEKWI